MYCTLVQYKYNIFEQLKITNFLFFVGETAAHITQAYIEKNKCGQKM
jgi:hypothetical protein